MLFLSEGWATDRLPTRSQVRDSIHWNLWTKRLLPFNDLTDGTRVVLVQNVNGAGRLTWEVEARDVLAASYRSKRDAVRLIATGLGLDAGYVRNHEYTQGHAPAGYVLAWRYKPVRRLDLPRPTDLEFRRGGRHGWLSEDDPAVLSRWGLSPRARSYAAQRARRVQAQQGVETDPVVRSAVERYAEEQALRQYRGWRHERRGKPYDFVLRRGRAVRYLEVKGSTTPFGKVAVTPREVQWSRSHTVDLVVVHDIEAIKHSDGTVTCSGGVVHKVADWSPTDRELTVRTYMCRVDGGTA
ncbi:MAG: protein NO VEIN domain-containing protein [Actinomycetota bacterium]